ncbi:MAG: ArsR family transcriptional regulator [Candidatus Thermoplasmatota archaeon]
MNKNRIMFNNDDKNIIHLFAELGMPMNLAKTLLYISKVDECRSKDIENATKLLQPQVSIAVQELQKKGWIKKQERKKKGKGRPVHYYHLNKSLLELLKIFENEKNDEIENIKKNLSELQQLIATKEQQHL